MSLPISNLKYISCSAQHGDVFQFAQMTQSWWHCLNHCQTVVTVVLGNHELMTHVIYMSHVAFWSSQKATIRWLLATSPITWRSQNLKIWLPQLILSPPLGLLFGNPSRIRMWKVIIGIQMICINSLHLNGFFQVQGTSCTGQSCAMKVCPAHVEGRKFDIWKVLGCNLWFLWFLSGDWTPHKLRSIHVVKCVSAG